MPSRNEISSTAISKCLRHKTISDADKEHYHRIVSSSEKTKPQQRRRDDDDDDDDDESSHQDQSDVPEFIAFRFFVLVISGSSDLSEDDKDRIAFSLKLTLEEDLDECLLEALMEIFSILGVTDATEQKQFSRDFVTYIQDNYEVAELSLLLKLGFDGLKNYKKEEAAKKAQEDARANRYKVGDLDLVAKNVVEDLGRGEDKSPISVEDLKALVERIREKSTEFIRDEDQGGPRFSWRTDSAVLAEVVPVDSSNTTIVVTTGRHCDIENSDGYGSYGGGGPLEVYITVDVATKKVIGFNRGGSDIRLPEDEIVAAFNGAATQ